MTINDLSTEIMACEQARCAALLDRDVAALSNLLSDRLVFTHANALSEGKDAIVAKMKAGSLVYRSLDVTDQQVIDLGDTALLLSRLTALVTVGATDKRIDNRTLSVWTREEGHWRLISYHPTPIRSPDKS